MHMDVEKTIEFMLGQQARFDAQLSQLTEKMDELTEKMDEQGERAAERAAEMDERHEREMADVRAVLAGVGYELRRGIRLSIEEHRRERVRRQALDTKMNTKMDQLAVSVQALIDAMKKDRNVN
jgi:4-aminobutyrate aminotransferase-like enzyme